MTEHTKGFALITGASAGIGAVYADRLARRGYDLILVARRADRLQAIAERITAEIGRNVEIVVADLSDRADLRRVEDILRNDTRISLLVNNAGLGPVAPLLNSNVEAMSDVIAVNIDCPDAPHLRCGAEVRGTRRRLDHQHVFRRGDRTRNPERRL